MSAPEKYGFEDAVSDIVDAARDVAGKMLDDGGSEIFDSLHSEEFERQVRRSLARHDNWLMNDKDITA